MLYQVTVSVLLLQTLCLVSECEGKANPARVLVNRAPVTPEGTSNSTVYHFIEGQFADISCTNSEGRYSQLQYFNSTGDRILITMKEHTQPAALKLKLSKSTDNNYILCIAGIVEQGKTKVIFRLLNTETENSIQVYINDVIQNMQRVKSSKNTFMQTHWIRSVDYLQLTCRKKHENNSTLALYHYVDSLKSKSNVSLTIHNVTENETVKCTIISDENIVQETAFIVFHLYNPGFYITGLRNTNITEEYKNEKNGYVMTYEYSGEEELNLICTKKFVTGQRSPQLIWMFNDEPQKPTNTYNTHSSNLIFNLLPVHDKSSLRCVDNERGSVVRQITIQFSYKSTDQKSEDEGVGFNIDPTVLVIVGCAALVSIVSVSCFMWCRVRRNKPKEARGVGEDYENLPSCNSSLPHPSQWEEPTYTEVSHKQRPGAGCEPLYQNNMNNTTKPSPQINPYKKLEGEYANIQDQTYEVVGGVKELNYVEVSFAKGVGTNRPTGAGEDRLYSEVVGVKSTKYDNVYDNSRYVNTYDGEYAEPAYCEPLNNK